MYIISQNTKQYKANLHSHSVLSDGKKTPEELKKMYKEKGYSVLSITDHEVPKNHSALSDDDFIMITGYEAYVRVNPNYVYDVYAKEIHMNFYAKEPQNEAIICYNKNAVKFIPDEDIKNYTLIGSQREREYSVQYINEYIKTAVENGYIVAYNHPYWSMESEEDVLKYEGFFSMEMCNYGSYLATRLEYNGALYDKMLLSGKAIACHGGDDNHNKYPEGSSEFDSFGVFTMIMPQSFTYDGIINAMEKGDMYCSMGPVFKEISVVGNKLHVECSPVQCITLHTGRKMPLHKRCNIDEEITSADFEIDDRAPFIRISACDKYGRAADTRGYFRHEFEK